MPINRDYRGRFQPYPTPAPPKVPPYKVCKFCNSVLTSQQIQERPYGYTFCSTDHVLAWRNEVQQRGLEFAKKLSGTALSDYNITLFRYVPNFTKPFPPPGESLGFNIAVIPNNGTGTQHLPTRPQNSKILDPNPDLHIRLTPHKKI